MKNVVVSNFLSNVVKKDWHEESERIGYTQELIVDVTEDLYEHVKSIEKAWDESELVYLKMYNHLSEEQWKELFGKRIFFINAIKVEKEKRSKGYGTEIIKNLELHAKNKKAEEIHLVIEEMDGEIKTKEEEEENIEKIKKWFQSLGYETVNIKNNVYMKKKQL